MDMVLLGKERAAFQGRINLVNMKPKEQRIKIAESCGWKFAPLQKIWVQFGRSDNTRPLCAEPPDYLNDLNAMAEAESHIKNQFMITEQTYWGHLRHVQPHPIYATASQRAEAFLRTLNLWTDEA